MKNFAKRLISTLIIAAAIPCTVFAGVEKGNPKFLWYGGPNNYDYINSVQSQRIISDKKYNEYSKLNTYNLNNYDSPGELAAHINKMLDAAKSAQKHNLPVFINGTFIDGLHPVNANGVSLAPSKAVAEAFDATSQWNLLTNKVSISNDTVSIEFTVGDTTASVNGVSKLLPVAPEIRYGSVYVPLRFLSENFGATLKYYDYEENTSGSINPLSIGKAIFIDEKYDSVISEIEAETAVKQACFELLENFKATYENNDISDAIQKEIENIHFEYGVSRYYAFNSYTNDTTSPANIVIYFDKVDGDMFYSLSGSFFYTIVDFDTNNPELYHLGFTAS